MLYLKSSKSNSNVCQVVVALKSISKFVGFRRQIHSEVAVCRFCFESDPAFAFQRAVRDFFSYWSESTVVLRL